MNPYPPAQSAPRKQPLSRLHALIWIVIASLLIPSYYEGQVFGFNISGWAWVIPVIASILYMASTPAKITFPIALWTPWLMVLIVNLALRYHEDALQRTCQMATPFIIGIAASQLRPTERDILLFVRMMRITFVLFLGSFLLNIKMVLSLSAHGGSSMATHSISTVMFATLFFTLVLHKIKGHRRYLLASSLIPLLTFVRGAIFALTSMFATNLSRMRIAFRLMIVLCLLVSGLLAFSTKHVQQRMFRSGTGTRTSLSLENPDFDAGGRKSFWDVLKKGIRDSPLIGNGANAHATALREAGLNIEPHNDWLRIAHDYGIPFATLLPLGILLQIRNGYVRAKRTTLYIRVLYLSGISAFVPFVTLMLTDNIIVYTQFYGNIQFLILGLAYAADAAQRTGTSLRSRTNTAHVRSAVAARFPAQTRGA